jgi:hypothetical protein
MQQMEHGHNKKKSNDYLVMKGVKTTHCLDINETTNYIMMT